jgi:hypothetical protein
LAEIVLHFGGSLVVPIGVSREPVVPFVLAKVLRAVPIAVPESRARIRMFYLSVYPCAPAGAAVPANTITATITATKSLTLCILLSIDFVIQKVVFGDPQPPLDPGDEQLQHPQGMFKAQDLRNIRAIAEVAQHTSPVPNLVGAESPSPA